MRAIREELGWTQLKLAVEMDCSDTTIENYEGEKQAVSAKTLAKFRIATDMDDTPLTEDEILSHVKELYKWNDLIVLGDKEQTAKLQPMLAHSTKWSFDEDLRILFDLFNARYCLSTGKRDECIKILQALSVREHELSYEHLFWYHRYLGLLDHFTWQYKSALFNYLKAEKLGDGLRLNDRSLYYNIGYCFAEMEYPYLAANYLERVLVNKADTFNIMSVFSTQRLLAISYSKLGRIEDALDLLENCIKHVRIEAKGDSMLLGGVYLDMGKVYQDAKNYDKAFEYYDLASQHYDENSEAFLEYLCIKATLLRTLDKTEMVQECLNKGLPVATKDTLWYEWFHALSKSLTLNREESIVYIEYTAIPKFHEYGKHRLAMECHLWISAYYRSKNKYKLALIFSDNAKAIYTKLMEGDISL